MIPHSVKCSFLVGLLAGGLIATVTLAGLKPTYFMYSPSPGNMSLRSSGLTGDKPRSAADEWQVNTPLPTPVASNHAVATPQSTPSPKHLVDKLEVNKTTTDHKHKKQEKYSVLDCPDTSSLRSSGPSRQNLQIAADGWQVTTPLPTSSPKQRPRKKPIGWRLAGNQARKSQAKTRWLASPIADKLEESRTQNKEDHKHKKRENDLVFDMGFNMGGDSMSYLLHGHRVVAVEANPILVAKARKHEFFAKMIETKELILLNVAVRGVGGLDHMTFYDVLGSEGVFGSVSHTPVLKMCDKCPGKCQQTLVPALTCEDLMRQYGIPLYLKIDIEGQDLNCILSISKNRSRRQLPLFVSFEGASVQGEELDALKYLSILGYEWFKHVPQYQYNIRSFHHSGQTSGPFGNFAADMKTGMSWRTLKKIMSAADNCPTKSGDWCDTHAMLGGQLTSIV